MAQLNTAAQPRWPLLDHYATVDKQEIKSGQNDVVLNRTCHVGPTEQKGVNKYGTINNAKKKEQRYTF